MDPSSSHSNNTNTRGRGRGRGRGDARGRGRGQNQDAPFRGRGRGSPDNPSFQSRGRGSHPPRGHFPRPPFCDPNDSRPVPSHSSIHPSTPVRIILKADQASGRTVTGIVADLLTRGDHPRGVKVRLRDGRVGRVQGIVSVEEGEAGERLVGGADAALDRDGLSGGGGRGRGPRIYRQERDIRDEDEYLYDETKGNERANDGWFAALEAADRKHEAKKDGKEVDEGGYEVVTCPVCMTFKGDEMAVQHHVEGHYVDSYK